jgi:tetratricopeptide (TPR) repeat protein
MIANLFKAADVSDVKSAAALLLAPDEKHAIGQASGLISFIKRFVHPGMDPSDIEILRRLRSLSEHEDPDLQALAFAALQIGYDQQPDIHSLCAQRLRSLSNEDPVRLRWAVADSYRGDAFSAQGDAQNAIFCFNRSLEVMPANVVTLSHLARAQLNSGAIQEASGSLQKALALQPSRAVLHFQLAVIYQRQQQVEQAMRELEEGLKYSPDDPTANRMLRQLRTGARP